MIFSANLLFSEDQDVSQTAGTYISTNVIDTGAPGTVYGASAAMSRNVGPGNKVPILVQMTEGLDSSGGAATITFQIETANVEAFSSTNVIIAQSRAFTEAEAVDGFKWGIDVLPSDCKRFLRVKYVIAGETSTAGTVTAGIVADVQTAA